MIGQGNSKPVTGLVRTAGLLTAVIGVGWVLSFWPARTLRGEAGVLWMSIAAICCLVPGWFVVVLGGLAIFRNEMMLILVQMAVRAGAAATAAIVVRLLKRDFGFVDFSMWLILFYVLSLVAEVYFVRSMLKQTENKTDAELS